MTPEPSAMARILAQPLPPNRAALWFLGQAGFVLRGDGVTVAIDPYLSDSVIRVAPDYGRCLPVPIEPEDLRVDLFIVTHDHLDHLDPETINRYPHKATTTFIAPRLACRKLASLGIPERNIVRVDSGEQATCRGVKIDGVWALPTGPDVPDTCGYRLELPGGRTVYHASDTAWCDLLLKTAVPAEVLLVCINGKFGNLDVPQAVRLTEAVRPKMAVPMHHDLMARNAADPQDFVRALHEQVPQCPARVLKIMDCLEW